MKRIILLVTIACALSLTVAAQQEGGQKDRLAGLNLTVDQKRSVDSVRQEYSKKIKSLKNDAALSQEDKLQKAKDLRKAQTQAIATLLTADQKKQLRQQTKEKQKKEEPKKEDK